MGTDGPRKEKKKKYKCKFIRHRATNGTFTLVSYKNGQQEDVEEDVREAFPENIVSIL